MKTYLITGCAGFIGHALSKRLLLDKEITLVGIDNMNSYYDVKLKQDRLNELTNNSNFIFIKGDISDKELIKDTFFKYNPTIVINLAAQAGVRYSIIEPDSYINSNIIGFYNILEACRNYKIKHLIYASSSSVYGDNDAFPYKVTDKVDRPKSLYAATKKSNELFAYSYSQLYDIPTTGLRFFTVYGPYGRPDMATFKFTNQLLNNEKIKLFNNGECERDFTYIDDVVEGIIRVIKNKPKNTYNIYNLGNSNPKKVLEFVDVLKEEMIKQNLLPEDYEIKKELLPMQDGDMLITSAEMNEFIKDFNYKPNTQLQEGLEKFITWYKNYYQ